MFTHIPEARVATYSNFKAADGTTIDQGIALFFPAPHSFTGEDVLELQGHGGPVVMNMLLMRIVELGARIAQPGEFSQRAFLNDKIDLSQAEAIADLIDSVSQQAAQGAMRSLQGEFSKKIKQLNERLINQRMYIEAAIDFPEEEVDFLSDGRIARNLDELECALKEVLQQANEGALLREGITLVLAGRTNAGKSSLMNQLSGRDSSIVATIPGTTRDLINEFIHLDGIPLKLVDTAGIRNAGDEVEQEGVRRALVEIENADGMLVLVDLQSTKDWQEDLTSLIRELPDKEKLLVVLNKIDVASRQPEIPKHFDYPVTCISAKLGTGMSDLKSLIKAAFSLDLSEEGSFIARARHVEALTRGLDHLQVGRDQLLSRGAGELLAEELRLCHESLSEITGEFSSDDLLGLIFSNFCIGK